MIHSLVRVAWLVSALPSVVGAQARDTVRVGERVRVQVAGDMRPIVATWREQRGDTLLLQGAFGTERALRRSVQQIERSLGRSRARGARHDALWGAAIGGGLLAMGGAYGMKGTDVALAVGFYGAVGGAVGALRRPERWRLAALPAAATSPTLAVSRDRTTAPVSDSTPFRHTLLALSPRDVIRFRVDGAERTAGTLVAATPDSLLLDRGGLSTRYAMARVSHLQRYYGRTSRAGGVHGGVIGGSVGVVIGGLFGLALTNVCFDVCNPNRSKAAGVVAGAALLGGLGAGIGAMIGQALPRDEWRTVHWEAR